ncbi:MAG: SufD family Fe-S cluster assembly protein, partial [Gemmatimonadota bacterium]|nr:SufD family Fe-S cluster assembly protein [Gemmatimonadota bacterium]
MTVAERCPKSWLSAIGAQAEESAAPEWLRELRRRGAESFAAGGFPSASEEDWRFTDISTLVATPFRLAETPARIADPAALGVPGLSGARFVFVDGILAQGASRMGGLPAGFSARPFAEAAADPESGLAQHLGASLDARCDGFVALNTGLMNDGLHLRVDQGVRVADPVHILHVSTGKGAPTMSHPRHLIVAGAGASLTVVEEFVSEGGEKAFTNAATEIVAEAGSAVRHYRLVRENPQSFHLATLAARQFEDSLVEAHVALLGGALARCDIRPMLLGERCRTLVNGVGFGSGNQRHDLRVRVGHSRPHGESRQYYRSVLADRARSVFTGRIVVDEGAQKTDAVQTNRNLLLSEDAV